MFDFTTTTIINSANDVKAVASDKIQLNKGVNLVGSKITSITRTKGTNPTLAKVDLTITNAATIDTTYRVALQLRLRNNNNPLYANDTIYKGKPLYFEAFCASGTSAENIAKAIKDTIDKKTLELTKLDGKEIIKVGISGANLTFTANSEFLIFKEAVVQEYVPLDTTKEDTGLFKTIIVGKPENGKLGFGTPAHLLRDIQLPSDANVRYKRLYEDETIITTENTLYNQYIITMETPRNFHGQSAVGQLLTSKTTHVFWVEKTYDKTFEASIRSAFASLATTENGFETV